MKKEKQKKSPKAKKGKNNKNQTQIDMPLAIRRNLPSELVHIIMEYMTEWRDIVSLSMMDKRHQKLFSQAMTDAKLKTTHLTKTVTIIPFDHRAQFIIIIVDEHKTPSGQIQGTRTERVFAPPMNWLINRRGHYLFYDPLVDFLTKYKLMGGSGQATRQTLIKSITNEDSANRIRFELPPNAQQPWETMMAETLELPQGDRNLTRGVLEVLSQSPYYFGKLHGTQTFQTDSPGCPKPCDADEEYFPEWRNLDDGSICRTATYEMGILKSEEQYWKKDMLLRSTSYDVDGKRDGPEQRNWAKGEGKPASQCTWSHGKKIGVEKSWHLNGKPDKVCYYNMNGIMEGLQESWYSTGGYEFTRTYNASGLLHGKETLWWPHEGSQKQEETEWVKGQRHGPSRGWHINGVPSFERTWHHGEKHGVERVWDGEGQLEQETMHEASSCVLC